MAGRSDYLQEMVNLVGRLVEDGFSEDEIQEMLAAAVAHVGGGSAVPYAPRDLHGVWSRPRGLERVPVGADGEGALPPLRQALVRAPVGSA